MVLEPMEPFNVVTTSLCKHLSFSSMHFLRVPVFSHQPVLFRRKVVQGLMRPLVVIFHQPALCNFPCFIQCSEQVKIQDFCPVCPVEPFDKRILCRLIHARMKTGYI